MSRIALLAALCLASPALASSGDEQPERIVELHVGRHADLHYARLQRIALADPQVAAVQVPHGDNVELVGLQPGQTELQIWANGRRHHLRVQVR
jgi:hypothetical protein